MFLCTNIELIIFQTLAFIMWISASLILLITLQQSALLPRFHAFRVHCHYVFNWLNIKRWELVLGFSSELCTTSSVTLISENEPVNQPQINFNYESLNESVKSSQTWRVMKVQGQRPSSYTQQHVSEVGLVSGGGGSLGPLLDTDTLVGKRELCVYIKKKSIIICC